MKNLKLLSQRREMAEKGLISMCTAEFDGTWIPYERPLKELTEDWLLEELTYDDCYRKEEIVAYLNEKINSYKRQIYDFNVLKKSIHEISNICKLNES